MKKITLVLLLGLLSCNTEIVTSDPNTQVDVVAEFHYSGLAYDGCDTRITVQNGTTPTDYIATSTTVEVLNKMIQTEQAKLPLGDYLRAFPVIISFKKTGQKGTLLCGWGMKSTVEMIDIQKIARK